MNKVQDNYYIQVIALYQITVVYGGRHLVRVFPGAISDMLFCQFGCTWLVSSQMIEMGGSGTHSACVQIKYYIQCYVIDFTFSKWKPTIGKLTPM